MSNTSFREITIGEDGERLDRWLRNLLPHLSHAHLQKLLRTGQIRVDGSRARPSLRLRQGQNVRLPPVAASPAPEVAPPGVQPGGERLGETGAMRPFPPERVLHIDDEMIVIDKPAGLAVQGGSGLREHLDGMLDSLRFGADERPRLVHRLDKDTSGILLLARNPAVARRLGDLFRSSRLVKTYWAVVAGVPEVGEALIDMPLIKRPQQQGEKVVVDHGDGKRAETRVRIVECVGDRLARVALRPLTGRTHQLRVHCAAMGWPVLGDGKYGGRAAFVGSVTKNKTRLHLHAASIAVPRADDAGMLRVAAPLPPHMAATWRAVGFSGPEDDPFGGGPFGDGSFEDNA